MYPKTPKESRPPYLLGLLCLIPLIGALVGIGLLLMAIFKYKDKWLAVIGVFGILFTIFVYGSLFYYTQHGKIPQQGLKDMAQMQLNGLVPDIEFYNLQNGHYPDSLPELTVLSAFVVIEDPSQAFQFHKNSRFNYKKENGKYLLFSSGKDGIPNTKDDIYPQIKITDSSKIGLILPK